MSDPVVTLFPPWRQAILDFMAAGFKPGDIVPHAWLAEHFGMPVLHDATTLSVAEYRDRQFQWLANIEAMKAELLEQHQIFLCSVFGQGWRWVPPHEQTGEAVKKFERDARHAYRQVGMRLTHLRIAELTDGQRRENSDAIGRLSLLEGMQKTLVKN
jgi:hypothetical protein